MLSLLLAPALLLHAPDSADDVAPLTWGGKKYDVDELPAELLPSAAEAYFGWATWAEENDYRLTLTDDQRVLVVQYKKRKPRKALALIEDVAEVVDTWLPTPEREADVDDGTLDGEPDEPPAPPEDLGPGETWSWEWVDDGGPLETDTAVILQLRNEPDQRAAVAKLAQDFDYLQGWAKTAHQRAGFSLERPLCAAWLEGAQGLEEYEPDHELINRVTQLLLLRRFGQIPFWLHQGLAWAVEWEMKERLYCFPYRAEFIYEAEHDQWLNLVRRAFEDRKKQPLELAEVANWQRGVFEKESAHIAFGLATFLARYRPEALSPYLEHLRIHRDEQGRNYADDGSWTRITGYEVPVEEQQRALLEIAGDDVLIEAGEFFRKLKRYRAPKR